MLVLKRKEFTAPTLKQNWTKFKRDTKHALGALELWDFAKTKDTTPSRILSRNAIHTATVHKELEKRSGGKSGLLGGIASNLVKDRDRAAWRNIDKRGNGAIWDRESNAIRSLIK